MAVRMSRARLISIHFRRAVIIKSGTRGILEDSFLFKMLKFIH